MPTKPKADPVVWTPASMGRKGGQAQVSKGFGKLSKARKREIAMMAVEAKQRKANERTRAANAGRSRKTATGSSTNVSRLEVA